LSELCGSVRAERRQPLIRDVHVVRGDSIESFRLPEQAIRIELWGEPRWS